MNPADEPDDGTLRAKLLTALREVCPSHHLLPENGGMLNYERENNLERSVKNDVFNFLARKHPEVFFWNHPTGMAWFKNGTPVRYGLVGSSDIVGMTGTGQFLGIETKHRVTGAQRAGQVKFQRAVEKRGGIYVLARSVEDVRKVIG